MVRKMVGIVVFDFLAGSLFTRKVLNPYQEMHLSHHHVSCSQVSKSIFFFKVKSWLGIPPKKSVKAP